MVHGGGRPPGTCVIAAANIAETLITHKHCTKCSSSSAQMNSPTQDLFCNDSLNCRRSRVYIISDLGMGDGVISLILSVETFETLSKIYRHHIKAAEAGKSIRRRHTHMHTRVKRWVLLLRLHRILKHLLHGHLRSRPNLMT